MPKHDRISITELKTIEAQLSGQPPDETGSVKVLKSGMLKIIQAAIAAEKALIAASPPPPR